MAHKAYGLNELREMYLKFFETKGHLRLPSFSLVPQNDKSILLINAGMTPMKPWFTGEEEPPRHRVTTCQKCIRTGDIENVGHTARHGTYFEMLGNFSFGDYFKKEAIPWAWEFLTSPEWVGLEPDRLFLEVVAEGEVAQHLKIRAVACSVTDALQVGRADALLAGGDAAARRHFLAGEELLHRRHARVDEQKRFVALRHERKARQAKMPLRLKERKILFAQVVKRCPFHGGFQSFYFI